MSDDVLFVKTSSLGDVIHHMPALTEAAARCPGIRFAWVIEETYAPLARLHRAPVEVIPVASRRWRRAVMDPSTWQDLGQFRRMLRARKYAAVVDTQGLIRSSLIARTARGCSHGYDMSSVREPAASLLYHVRHRVMREQHAIARNRTLTGLSLGYEPDGPPDFGLDRTRLATAPWADRYAVLLHATAQPSKEWPLENWIAIGRSLSARGLRPVLPWGNGRERARSAAIAAALPDAIIPDLQPLDAVARALAGASLVVGVDTGLLHLASALGMPLVAIFAGSDPSLTGPLGQGPIAIVGRRGESPEVAAVLAALDRIA